MGNTVTTLTPAEEITLLVIPIIMGLLSFMGSGSILYSFLAGKKEDPSSSSSSMSPWRKKMSNIKYRLLACICLSDLINSLSFVTWTLPVPREIPYMRYGNYGNRATCDASGLIMHLGNVGAAYNAALALYFVLSLKYRMTDRAIAEKYEIYMHIWGILWPLSTGLASLGMGLFNFGGVGCWITTYPYMCHLDDNVECTRASNAYFYVWAFTGIPIIINNTLIVVCMYMTYQTVRRTYKRAHRPIQQAASRGYVPEEHVQAARSRYTEKIKQSGIQGFLYSAAYICTHIWAFLSVTYEQWNGPAHFWMLILHFILWPLQGFFNVFIFLRPTILYIRRRHPEFSYLYATYLATFHEEEPGRLSFTADSGPNWLRSQSLTTSDRRTYCERAGEEEEESEIKEEDNEGESGDLSNEDPSPF